MAYLNPMLGRRRVLAHATTLCIAGLATSVIPQTLLAAAVGDDTSTATKKRIFITGSTTGLGQMAARLLVEQGHRVVLHGRSPASAQKALQEIPGAEAALHGDSRVWSRSRTLLDRPMQSAPLTASSTTQVWAMMKPAAY